METPRYINTINGVYDTVERRIIYGMPPVPTVPLHTPDKDSGGDCTSEMMACSTSKADEPTNPVVIQPDDLSDKTVGELPTGYLLAEVEQLAYKIAHVLDCPLDIVISTMFAVVSGAVGTKVKVYDGKYTNMLNINVCHVAPPGSNKTQPVSLLVKPLEQISMRKNLTYREELQRCKEMKETVDMPKPQILYVSNPTPEAINKMMAYNPHGLFARRDELAGFIDDLSGRYSNGSGGIPDFLSIFTNENISIIRVGEEPLIIPKPYLTVVGGIQPNVIGKFLGKENLIYSGFNYRWLFVVPEIKISIERNMHGILQGDLDYWEMLIEKFHNIKPMVMTFDNDAQLLLSDYFREIRLKKIDGNDTYMDEVRDKLFIYLEKWAALATLLHGDNIEVFGNQPKENMGNTFENCMPCEPVIDAKAVEYAIQCMHVFEDWAMKVRDMLPLQAERKLPTLGEAIKVLNSFHPILNKKMFAESCGMTREQLYKYLPKTPKSENNKRTINPEVTPINAAEADKQVV